MNPECRERISHHHLRRTCSYLAQTLDPSLSHFIWWLRIHSHHPPGIESQFSFVDTIILPPVNAGRASLLFERYTAYEVIKISSMHATTIRPLHEGIRLIVPWVVSRREKEGKRKGKEDRSLVANNSPLMKLMTACCFSMEEYCYL